VADAPRPLDLQAIQDIDVIISATEGRHRHRTARAGAWWSRPGWCATQPGPGHIAALVKLTGYLDSVGC
jgi:hypothetical protein